MSLEENKAIARRWNDELWSKGNVAALDELMAPDFTWHTPFPGMASDLHSFKQSLASLSAFTEVKCTTEDVIAEGDKVAVRWNWSGKHTGDYMGIPPTGKQAAMMGISILRIAGGKVTDEWDEQDNMGFMMQLGAKMS